MARARNQNKKIQFQLGWGGLIALTVSTLCALLWMFVLGFWAGQKLAGRSGTTLPQASAIAPGSVAPPSLALPDLSEGSSGKVFSSAVGREEQANGQTGQKVEPGKKEVGPPKLLTEVIGEEGGPAKEVESHSDSLSGKEKKLEGLRPKTTYFTLQIASFKSKERAEKEARRWRSRGMRAVVKSRDLGKKGVWYRVYIGRFRSVGEAKAKARELADTKGLSSYVVPLKE